MPAPDLSGTTTATVLTRAILVEGCKSVAAGMNPMDLRRHVKLAGGLGGGGEAGERESWTVWLFCLILLGPTLWAFSVLASANCLSSVLQPSQF